MCLQQESSPLVAHKTSPESGHGKRRLVASPSAGQDDDEMPAQKKSKSSYVVSPKKVTDIVSLIPLSQVTSWASQKKISQESDVRVCKDVARRKSTSRKSAASDGPDKLRHSDTALTSRGALDSKPARRKSLGTRISLRRAGTPNVDSPSNRRFSGKESAKLDSSCDDVIVENVLRTATGKKCTFADVVTARSPVDDLDLVTDKENSPRLKCLDSLVLETRVKNRVNFAGLSVESPVSFCLSTDDEDGNDDESASEPEENEIISFP